MHILEVTYLCHYSAGHLGGAVCIAKHARDFGGTLTQGSVIHKAAADSQLPIASFFKHCLEPAGGIGRADITRMFRCDPWK